MQNITLSQLIKISPLSEGVKQKLLSAEPGLNPSQKSELFKTLWRSISTIYHSFVAEKSDQMLEEMIKGQHLYEKKDFQNAESEIFNKLLVKIDETQSQEEVETLKQQLKSPLVPPPIN